MCPGVCCGLKFARFYDGHSAGRVAKHVGNGSQGKSALPACRAGSVLALCGTGGAALGLLAQIRGQIDFGVLYISRLPFCFKMQFPAESTLRCSALHEKRACLKRLQRQ